MIAAERPDGDTLYIFVSYASADRDRVLPVVAALRRAGIPVWLDQQGIAGGANYGAEIADAIKNAAALVLMCSAASLASRNVKQEIALGWRFERPYVPLLLEAVTIPDDLAYWLEASQWVEVLDKPEEGWLPAALAALARVGIAPARPAVSAAGPASGAPIPLITLPAPPSLVGREREQAVLRERWAATLNGRGAVVLIGGEAGMGKTALAAALAHEAAGQGALVLDGHCYDLAETPPYGPWIDLFARYPTGTSLPPPPDAFAQRGTVGAVASQMALFVQVQDFLRALTDRSPVVLLLDDLHWADPASLDLLRFLARSIATLPLLILVTYRSDELTRRHPLYQLLPSLVRDSAAERIDLRRLDEGAVRALVDARYGLAAADAARLAAYLQSRAEGNALFTGELLRSLEEAGALRREDEEWALGDLAAIAVPTLLRQVIDGRLARLGNEEQRLLAVAAVIGHDVPLDVWAAVGEVDEDNLLDTVEQAIGARLLIEAPDGERVQFAHALIREALYEGALSTRRRRLHRRTGEALVALPQPDPDAIAYHFQRAGDTRTAHWLVAAGDRAERTYAYLTAAERFEAALAAMEGQDADAAQQGWLLLRLALLRRFSEPQRSIAYIEAAAPFVAASNDPALAAYVTLIGGFMRCLAGDVRRGIPGLEAGVQAIGALSPGQAPQSLPSSLAVALDHDRSGVGLLVLWLVNAGRYIEALRLGEPLIAHIPPTSGAGAGDHVPHGDIYMGLAAAYAALGFPEQSRLAYAHAREDYFAIGNLILAGTAAVDEVRETLAPYFSDDIDARHRLANEAEITWARASAAVGGRDSRWPHLLSFRIEGEWHAMREAFQEIRSGLSRRHSVYIRGRDLLGSVARWQGDTALAWEMVHEALPDGPATEPANSPRFSTTITCVRLAVALALDTSDLAAARRWIETHDRWMAWSGAVLGQSEGQALWAAYHRVSSDPTMAYLHAERALVHATEPRQPLALLDAHRLIGELDTEAGRYEDADAHLQTSLSLADACAAPYERALTLLATAELRAATGDTADATVLLDEVRTICTPLGAKPALARVDALAATMG